MSTTRTASCLCGNIKVTMEGEPFSTNTCHCSSCQKFSGAVFASLGVYKTEQVKITESEPGVLSTYNDTTPESGAVMYRCFCSRCGSPISGQKNTTPDMIVVPVGIFDGDKTDLKPRLEYFARSRVDWIAPIENAQPFEKLPPPQPQ